MPSIVGQSPMTGWVGMSSLSSVMNHINLKHEKLRDHLYLGLLVENHLTPIKLIMLPLLLYFGTMIGMLFVLPSTSI